MKKQTIFITLALLLVLPAVLMIWGFALPCQYGDTFMGALGCKVQRLRETPGPRIVLVGGSGVAFGVDSALMERELPDYQVVNFGMYAALGTTVMLDLSEDLIRPGDIVILIPEQQEQTLSDYFDAAVMWQGLDGNFGLLRSMPREKLKKLLGQFPSFAGQKFSCYFAGKKPESQGVYARASFNGYGDVDSPFCARNEMPGGYDGNTPIRFDGELLHEGFVSRVDKYQAAIRGKDARLWYAMCPMNERAVSGAATPEDFYRTLTERLNVPVIGNPNDSVLPAVWFYDTNFHLNNNGKLVYTRLLIDEIKAMLGDSSPTEIALPPAPEIAEETVWRGDDSDGDCFLYEARDGAWAVTGLTETGMERQTLTVPAVWEDMPVWTLEKEALSSGANLREIRIQQNIRAIADGAFSGCGKLERILLDQETPSACRVGQGLLQGTNALVLVPEGALKRYRTDYFWSLYSGEIRPRAADE